MFFLSQLENLNYNFSSWFISSGVRSKYSRSATSKTSAKLICLLCADISNCFLNPGCNIVVNLALPAAVRPFFRSFFTIFLGSTFSNVVLLVCSDWLLFSMLIFCRVSFISFGVGSRSELKACACCGGVIFFFAIAQRCFLSSASQLLKFAPVRSAVV